MIEAEQARRIAGTILFFSDGKLAETGPAEAFFAAPASEAARRYLAGQL